MNALMTEGLTNTLKEKVAIVTGASSGIGLSIAKLYAQCGAHVVMVGRNLDKIKAAQSQIMEYGPEIAPEQLEALVVDLAIAEQIGEAISERLSVWGRVDILVNNAGVTRDGLLMKMSDSDWSEVLDVNLNALFHACRAVTRPMMKQRSGSIINISSVTALMGNAGQVNYGAAKAGMIGLTKSLAKELGSRNVRVNAIAPGFVETKMTQSLPPGMIEQYKSIIPQGRFGQSQEIASVAWFLASELSSYMTGQVLVVDGGLFMA